MADNTVNRLPMKLRELEGELRVICERMEAYSAIAFDLLQEKSDSVPGKLMALLHAFDREAQDISRAADVIADAEELARAQSIGTPA